MTLTNNLKDIVPIPQPKDSPPQEFVPLFSATPNWIAHPVRANTENTASFISVGVDEDTAKHLQRKGYEQAFAVQTAVLPLLLSGPNCHRGDLCVSAPTGSGKTLAYILPIVQALKKRPVPRLSAIIVAPTRDLVKQIREVANQCVERTSLQIGIATGNQPFATEQDLLINKGCRYDPQGYEELQRRANETYLCGRDGIDQYLKDAIQTLVYHVPHYESKVDILICTPGRLADHLRSTVGFNLDDVEWFIIDEVDSMIDRDFHLWANTVIKQLYEDKPVSRRTTRDKLLMKLSGTTRQNLVRKVVLSATMTMDISKLQLLQLKRPRLVVLENYSLTRESLKLPTSKELQPEEDQVQSRANIESAIVGDKYELPATLYEWAVPVNDDAYKPLYILWLFHKRILTDEESKPWISSFESVIRKRDSEPEMMERNISSSSSNDDSSGDINEPEGRDHIYLSGALYFNSSYLIKAIECQMLTYRPLETDHHLPNRSQIQPQPQMSILIFTKSNESAARLAHLLSHLLDPPYSKSICLLDKSSSSNKSRSSQATVLNPKLTVSAFRRQSNRLNQNQSQGLIPSILIASDRASRGLDVRSIRHVINYDVPRDVRGYVHRAGRTARANERGNCWTLYSFKEAAWFWREIGRNDSGSIGRGGRKVEKVKVDNEVLRDEWKERYERALEELRNSVMDGNSRGNRKDKGRKGE